MADMQSVHQNNAALNEYGPGLVAVFVGGTSGIGESTAHAFVRHALNPHVYLIGQNAEQAAKIIKEMQEANPWALVRFLKKDISLLGDVNDACKEIQERHNEVNILFMSPGVSKGGYRTQEGLDKKLSLHYYARMRFVVNLMPQLTTGSNRLSRVISVLGAGGEGPLILEDLSLKTNYSLRNCANHAITMTSLAMNELSQAHPSISFIHTYPGVVKTNLTRDMGTVAHVGAKMLLNLATPWIVPLKESGERHLYLATNKDFGRLATRRFITAPPANTEFTMQAYLVDYRGLPRQNLRLLQRYNRDGISRTVWAHTLDVFKNVGASDLI
ncbi:hypothetical protein BJY01DRAFT_256644 [Aspergillus pseudoustus]|uniref:Short-chain dehydrogenase/reductase n=1 Tax=Aspergillus pseudoustus TaxID=1810923 RepID=A0ABR4L1T2_9EURO